MNSLDAQAVITEALYVDGFVVRSDPLTVVYNHAWLETADGVIEPTPGFLHANDQWMHFGIWEELER